MQFHQMWLKLREYTFLLNNWSLMFLCKNSFQRFKHQIWMIFFNLRAFQSASLLERWHLSHRPCARSSARLPSSSPLRGTQSRILVFLMSWESLSLSGRLGVGWWTGNFCLGVEFIWFEQLDCCVLVVIILNNHKLTWCFVIDMLWVFRFHFLITCVRTN